jgi:hypothetical protein
MGCTCRDVFYAEMWEFQYMMPIILNAYDKSQEVMLFSWLRD